MTTATRRRIRTSVDRSLVVVTAMAIATSISGCVGPARSEADYLAGVSNTGKSAISAAESAQLTIEAVVAGKAAAPYVSRRLSEDEQRLQSAITAFSSVQPPTEAMDRLRSEVLTTMNRAASVLGRLRIAAYRNENERLADIARPLADLSSQFGRFEHLG